VAISTFASLKIETVKQFPGNLYILQWLSFQIQENGVELTHERKVSGVLSGSLQAGELVILSHHALPFPLTLDYAYQAPPAHGAAIAAASSMAAINQAFLKNEKQRLMTKTETV